MTCQDSLTKMHTFVSDSERVKMTKWPQHWFWLSLVMTYHCVVLFSDVCVLIYHSFNKLLTSLASKWYTVEVLNVCTDELNILFLSLLMLSERDLV